MQSKLPIVGFCGIPASRLIIGSRPFCGKSHHSDRDDREMKERGDLPG